MNWSNITIDKLQLINMQVTDKNGYSALHHLSARNTNTKTLQAAIDNGADVNKVDGQGHTPLHHAAIKNTSPDIAILLIDNGADVTTKDNNGKTPVEAAEYNKNFRNKMQRKIKKYLNPKKEKAMEKQYANLKKAGANSDLSIKDNWNIDKQQNLTPRQQAKQAVADFDKQSGQNKNIQQGK